MSRMSADEPNAGEGGQAQIAPQTPQIEPDPGSFATAVRRVDGFYLRYSASSAVKKRASVPLRGYYEACRDSSHRSGGKTLALFVRFAESLASNQSLPRSPARFLGGPQNDRLEP
jgi:hypothetical protein